MSPKFVIRDSQGHSKTVIPEELTHLKLSGAITAFFRKHVSAENATFTFERPDDQEALTMETGTGIMVRQRGDEAPEFTRFTAMGGGGQNYWLRFATSGYAALDTLTELLDANWVTDRESVLPDDSYANFELADVEARAKAEERRRLVRSMPKLDRKLLKQFCQAWGNHGYNVYDGEEPTFHVLFDGGTSESVAAARSELLDVISELGLETVDAPADAPAGSIWVRADPRVDLELEKW